MIEAFGSYLGSPAGAALLAAIGSLAVALLGWATVAVLRKTQELSRDLGKVHDLVNSQSEAVKAVIASDSFQKGVTAGQTAAPSAPPPPGPHQIA